MTALPVRDATARPRLKVVRGRRTLPRLAMVPWLAYAGLLALAFLGLVYSQTSLNERAMELDTLREQVAMANADADALRLEIARLESPERIVARATDMGMRLPDVPLRTLLVDPVPTSEPVVAGPGRIEAAP